MVGLFFVLSLTTLKKERDTLVMGRGDKRTRKGKITAGSYGVSRPKSANKPTAKPKADKPAKKAAAPKAAAKKTATKKAAAKK